MSRLAVVLLAVLVAACATPSAPAVKAPAAAKPTAAAPVSIAPTPTVPAKPTAAPSATTPSKPTAAPTPVPKPAVPTPAAPAKPTSAAGAARKSAPVVRVVDGDTVRLVVDGREEPVRVIGLDTPETVDPRRSVECFGREASRRATELLPVGAVVQVAADPTQDTRDAFQRLLLHVWLPDGRSFARTMIAEGFAHEYTYRVPYQGQAEYRAAQREAEAASRGLWAPSACLAPTTQPPAKAPVSPAATRAPAAAQGAGITLAVQGASPGGRASATVTTAPGVVCAIIYTTPAGTNSTAQGLGDATTSAAGVASWSWTIGPSTRPGTGSVRVTCGALTATQPIQVG